MKHTMSLAIQLRQLHVTPQNAQRKSEFVWFLVNHVEPLSDTIEFSGPEHCGFVHVKPDTEDGGWLFELTSATIAKYPDAARQYQFLTIYNAASALEWPAHLRIDTPDMNEEPPPARLSRGTFADHVIAAAVVMNKERGIDAQVNFTGPNHSGNMEIMAVRPPFHFVFDYADETQAKAGGPWRARVWLKPAEDSTANPAYSSAEITPRGAAPEQLAEACMEYINGFRINPALVGRMTAKLFNSDNYPTLDAAMADKGWVGNTEEVSGFSNILDNILNMKAASEVTGSDSYVSIKMRVEVGPSGNYIDLPECTLREAAAVLESIFA